MERQPRPLLRQGINNDGAALAHFDGDAVAEQQPFSQCVAPYGGALATNIIRRPLPRLPQGTYIGCSLKPDPIAG